MQRTIRREGKEGISEEEKDEGKNKGRVRWMQDRDETKRGPDVSDGSRIM